MRTAVTPQSTPRLWGIYYVDREYAHGQGDPLRTVVQAATKEEAEREAVRLGFDSPWAHPVTETEAQEAEWLPLTRPLKRAGRTTSIRQRI